MAMRKITTERDRSAVKAADRSFDLKRYGNQFRTGGRKPWTQKNGKAVASKTACRKGEF